MRKHACHMQAANTGGSEECIICDVCVQPWAGVHAYSHASRPFLVGSQVYTIFEGIIALLCSSVYPSLMYMKLHDRLVG